VKAFLRSDGARLFITSMDTGANLHKEHALS
jgi:hypothetical protein